MDKDNIKQIRKAIDDWMVQTMSEHGLIPTPVYDAIYIIDAAMADPHSEPTCWISPAMLDAIGKHPDGHTVLCGKRTTGRTIPLYKKGF